MYATTPLLAEFESILLANVGRTRFSLVLAGMHRGLTNEEMSAEADRDGIPCSAESIGMVRRTLTLTLSDQLHPAPSDAENQSYLYREVLNYNHSPELHKHVMTRLSQRRSSLPRCSEIERRRVAKLKSGVPVSSGPFWLCNQFLQSVSVVLPLRASIATFLLASRMSGVRTSP